MAAKSWPRSRPVNQKDVPIPDKSGLIISPARSMDPRTVPSAAVPATVESAVVSRNSTRVDRRPDAWVTKTCHRRQCVTDVRRTARCRAAVVGRRGIPSIPGVRDKGEPTTTSSTIRACRRRACERQGPERAGSQGRQRRQRDRRRARRQLTSPPRHPRGRNLRAKDHGRSTRHPNGMYVPFATTKEDGKNPATRAVHRRALQRSSRLRPTDQPGGKKHGRWKHSCHRMTLTNYRRGCKAQIFTQRK